MRPNFREREADKQGRIDGRKEKIIKEGERGLRTERNLNMGAK